mgnify:FL=1|tara:strand:- start:62 stop:280 length:219 start_codon:yes stop_codon:yes gene_type:complete
MNKSQIYLLLGVSIIIFELWDMADHFFGGLGFPRGDWETSTWRVWLPFVLFVLIVLLQREKDREKTLDQGDD